MTDAKDAAAKVLEAAGTFAATIASVTPGPVGAGFAGASTLAKAAAEAIRLRGDSIDDILARVKAPRSVTFPWDDTPPERPSGKGQQ